MNLLREMQKCEQTSGQSVLDHGLSVLRFYEDLTTIRSFNWKLPIWLIESLDKIKQCVFSEEIVEEYLIFHDCGKPFCKEERDGKIHFPNHAEVSANVYLDEGHKYFDLVSIEDIHTVADLIRDDMCLHTMNSAEIKYKCSQWSKEHAATLLLAAFAELHSNAEMFGGIESTSFKIKYKHLDRRGKQMCRFYYKG